MQLSSIAFLGNGGGLAKELATYSLIVPSTSTARIQEVQFLLCHILCDLIERSIWMNDPKFLKWENIRATAMDFDEVFTNNKVM